MTLSSALLVALQDGLARNKPIVVVGTPGRLAEFMRSGALKLHRTPLLVLDEVGKEGHASPATNYSQHASTHMHLMLLFR
jgi:hypothetical protein